MRNAHKASAISIRGSDGEGLNDHCATIDDHHATSRSFAVSSFQPTCIRIRSTASGKRTMVTQVSESKFRADIADERFSPPTDSVDD